MMPTNVETNTYAGPSRLMDNYGWVQNSSNLSTIRDVVDLVSEYGMTHNALMLAIRDARLARGEIKKKWTWDARCRIKAICATGMVRLDRNIQGYYLTELGKQLKRASKSDQVFRGKRVLSDEEIEIFKKGLLSNPPVISVLSILNESRRSGKGPLSKYEVGSQLGFVGDIGFTHYDEVFVARTGGKFNDVEGDADKWARTIISWLKQVGWVVQEGERDVLGKKLPIFTTTHAVDRVLQYSARSTEKYVPQEMLCSDHHPFVRIIQNRRAAILKQLSSRSSVSMNDILSGVSSAGIEITQENLCFDIINLRRAGFQISNEQSNYRLLDAIQLDLITNQSGAPSGTIEGIESQIEHYVIQYGDTIPMRLVDGLIRYGSAGRDNPRMFEMSVESFFSFMGFHTTLLGQGGGRVADVIARYEASRYADSYALIIDAKASTRYEFPVGDVRKMKEYINLHGPELLQERIPHHAFAFVSVDFATPDSHLLEIAEDTSVNGTAIDVFELMVLGSKVAKQELAISNLYPYFTTNKRFSSMWD